MNIDAEFEKRKGEVFPQGKIILWDGRALDCYPLAAQAPGENFQSHTTVQYPSIGAALPEPEEAEQQKQLFIKNAFRLLAHRERILSDSRMFLCRVPIQSGLAYTGTSGFSHPTLGVYLEWWPIVEGAMRIDSKGRKSLVYHLAGSPLSGANKCTAVREDGETETVSLSPFNAHWGPFTRINNRYTEAKQRYQAYTLQEVLDILHHEDNHIDEAQSIKIQFMTHENEVLHRRIEQIKDECDMWHNKYTYALIRYNETKIRAFYAEYEAFKAKADIEIEQLKAQKRALKAELKSGRIDNITYQKQFSPLANRISDWEAKIEIFRFGKVQETFPQEKDLTFNLIEQYILTKKNSNNNPNQ